MSVTFEQARQVRARVESELHTLLPAKSIVSIGIGKQKGDFVIAVGLNGALLADAEPPTLRVDGVRVVYELVGPAVVAAD
jgi:hypothetical protein